MPTWESLFLGLSASLVKLNLKLEEDKWKWMLKLCTLLPLKVNLALHPFLGIVFQMINQAALKSKYIFDVLKVCFKLRLLNLSFWMLVQCFIKCFRIHETSHALAFQSFGNLCRKMLWRGGGMKFSDLGVWSNVITQCSVLPNGLCLEFTGQTTRFILWIGNFLILCLRYQRTLGFCSFVS